MQRPSGSVNTFGTFMSLAASASLRCAAVPWYRRCVPTKGSVAVRAQDPVTAKCHGPNGLAPLTVPCRARSTIPPMQRATRRPAWQERWRLVSSARR